MDNPVKYYFKAEIDLDTDDVKILSVEPRLKCNCPKIDMNDLFTGLPDKQYDRDVPEDFGKRKN